MKIDVEQKITIPWLVIPPNQGENGLTAMFSWPDGTISEFEVTAQEANQLSESFAEGAIWSTVVESLLKHMRLNA